MNLLSDLTKTLLIWFFVTFVLILLVLLPRGNPLFEWQNSRTESTKAYEESITSFSWEDYKYNITSTFSYWWEHKSLGDTKYLHSVEYEVWRYLKKSLIIIIPSIFISFIFGILKGLYDFYAVKRKIDPLGQPSTVFFLSVPDFFLLLFIQVAIMTLTYFGFPHIALYGSESVTNKVIPIIFLSLYPSFYIAKLTFASLEQEASQDYIRTAMSKGTTNKKIIWKHMLSNCWLTILSHINTVVLYILSNLFVVELITSYRGAAYRFYTAFNVQKVFALGSSKGIEIPIVILFIIVFTFIMLITQIISKIASFRLLGREGDHS